MDILGIGKMVAGVVNGFGERKDRKNQLLYIWVRIFITIMTTDSH